MLGKRKHHNIGITKILYIQTGVDEKLSAIKLEEETSKVFDTFICIFTVVTDPLIGLECTEHTAYDMIFVEDDQDQVLNAYGLLISLRTVGADMPIILLADVVTKNTRPNMNNGLPPTGIKAKSTNRFTTILQKPFTKRDICEIIRSIVLSDPNYYTSTEEERLNSSEVNDLHITTNVCSTEIDDDIIANKIIL